MIHSLRLPRIRACILPVWQTWEAGTDPYTQCLQCMREGWMEVGTAPMELLEQLRQQKRRAQQMHSLLCTLPFSREEQRSCCIQPALS